VRKRKPRSASAPLCASAGGGDVERKPGVTRRFLKTAIWVGRRGILSALHGAGSGGGYVAFKAPLEGGFTY